MHRALQNFVDRLHGSTTADDLRAALAEVLEGFDFEAFAYLRLNATGKPTLLSTYAVNWTSHYLNAGYEGIDPVILQARRASQPFAWGPVFEHADLSPSQARLLAEAADFGIRQGYTVPVRAGAGSLAAVTFVSSEPRGPFLARIERLSATLTLIAACFNAQASWRLGALARLATLSPRELECLHWAAEGKSAWETSRILGVARRTIVFHLENAKAKLGVHHVCQAVALLARAG